VKRLVLALVVAVPLGAFAQGKQPPSAPEKPKAGAQAPAASVNWEGQTIKATGSGAPDMKAANAAQARLGAEKAAKMDAFRNLLEQVRGIHVSSGKTVGDVMGQKEELRGRVEGLIRGYKITAKRYFSDSGVELDVEVPLAGISAAVNAPAAEGGGGSASLNTSGEAANTGLVIDARGLKVTPALSPRVLSEDGKAVYSAECLSEAARKTQGVASYFQSLDDARKSALVGEKPLVVKASSANGSDLVLGSEDLKKLVAANNAYLAEGRVAIVTN